MEWISSSVEATEARGESLGKRLCLRPDWSRHVFLFGEMGAGKTALTRGLAKGLGVADAVSSPTYALINEYALPDNPSGLKVLSHFDLYRAREASALSLPEVTEALTDPSRVTVIEWSEYFPADLLPARRIEVRLAHSGTAEKAARTVEMRFFDNGVPDQSQIEELWQSFQTPTHVLDHINAVATVAVFLAERLQQNGYPVNLALVRAGALLHDVVRVCNFKHLDPACFQEEVTPAKLAVWQGQIKKYGNRHHADAAAEILRRLGFVAAADVVARHHTAAALEDLTLEEKCVLLGDRHVLHATIVPLAKRMQDGIVRHDHNANPRAQEIKQRIREIFAEVCMLGSINAADFVLTQEQD